MSETVKARSSGEFVTLAALFISFLNVALLGLGGGLVWTHLIVVEQRQWMDDHEFTEP
jgi:chromate transport protein ChrA